MNNDVWVVLWHHTCASSGEPPAFIGVCESESAAMYLAHCDAEDNKNNYDDYEVCREPLLSVVAP